MNRRVFFEKTCLGVAQVWAGAAFLKMPGLPSLQPTRVLKNEGRLKHVVRCELPYSMGYDAFTHLSRNWINVDLIGDINSRYIGQGLMFEDDYVVDGNAFVWTYYFKDEASFDHWVSTVTEYKVLKQENIHHGFRYSDEQFKLG